MDSPDPRRGHQHGQVLVLFVLSLVALLAMTGLIVDGGNAWAQQRQTQNAADSAAEAGTVILAQWYASASAPSTSYAGTCPTVTTNTWDQAVCQAVYGAGAYNGVTVTRAYYTNYDGLTTLGTVGGGSLPTGAQGIRVLGQKQFGTYLAAVVGITQLSTGAEATAVVGTVDTYCPPGSVCGALPVTFPVQTSMCTGNGTLQVGDSNWPTTSGPPWNPALESTVPLCKNGPGSVGWLQWPCQTQNGTPGLIDEITAPCSVDITVPAWISTSTGNTNDPGVEAALNAYHDQLVWLPEFDNTRGTGSGLQYHIIRFQAFYLDAAYITGNNVDQCDPALVGKNGSNGCLTGWFTDALAPSPVHIGGITQSSTQTLGVQLIR